MIDEMAEFEEYDAQRKDMQECMDRQNCAGCDHKPSGFTFECLVCPNYNKMKVKLKKQSSKNNFRFKPIYFVSPGRVLRVVARHHLFHDEKNIGSEKNINEKIDYVHKKLFEFYCDVILSKNVPYVSMLDRKLETFMESLKKAELESKEKDKDKSIHSKYPNIEADLRKLNRYMKPYFEQKDNAFTFHSIIADAMNMGKLNEPKEPVKITMAEAAHLINLTGHDQKEEEGDLPQILILALLCYYRAASDDMKLPGDYLPVVGVDFNAWLRNKHTFGVKAAWKGKSSYNFLDIVKVSNNLRYKIDKKLLSDEVDAYLKEMDEDKKEKIKSRDSFLVTDKDGKIRDELKIIIKEVRAL